MVMRIAILGGGPAALGVAYELTNVPGWETRYAVDVYQVGWRLGGKCASSRNRAARGRNEEHGLHILGGFYHNTFQQLRPLYTEWGRISPHAMALEDAVFPHPSFTLMERTPAGWDQMRVRPPMDGRQPGVKPEQLTPLVMLKHVLEWIAHALQSACDRKDRGLSAQQVAALRAQAAGYAAVGTHLSAKPWEIAKTAVLQLSTSTQTAMAALASEFGLVGGDWIGVIELVATIARGFVADQLPLLGYDSINGFEAEAWLRRHGASERAIACPLFEAGYHYAFAFPDGGERHDMAAGSGTRGLLRMVFGSHGSMFWHMNGGMGEVFVAPYYEVLKARGVQFNFFQRVEALVPGADGRLAAINVRVQARPKAGRAGYEPLTDYKLPGGGGVRRCWPAAPLADQLEWAASTDPAVLESWTAGAGVGVPDVLTVGKDFDLCVVGLSIGTLREIAAPLAAAEPRWRQMLDSAATCPTIAAQIWREEPVSTFGGWSGDGLLTAYARPLDTWADMSFLTPLEQPVQRGQPAGSLSYFCGPYSAAATSDTAADVEAWLQAHAAEAFPGLDNGNGGYRGQGELERYVKPNTDPLELHVCTPAGSVDARLRPDGSGFSNLMLAGDWTRHNFDVGCVESAILSARLCARAICGAPQQIYAESDFH